MDKKNINPKKILAIVISILTVFLLVFLIVLVVVPSVNYNNAIDLMGNGKYEQAIAAFIKLDGYKDSEEQILEANYLQATQYQNNNEIDEAALLFGSIAHYKDSKEKSYALWDEMGVRKTISVSGIPLAIKNDGTIFTSSRHTNSSDWVWVNEIQNWDNIASVFATYTRIIGVKKDGTIISVSDKTKTTQLINECGLTNIVKVTGNEYHTIGIRIDGTPFVLHHCSSAENCKFNGIENLTNIVDISCPSEEDAIALKADGTVSYVIGEDEYGENNVGNWTDVIAIAAGCNHTVGLKKDGTVVATGSNQYAQCNVSEWKNIESIAVNDNCTVGVVKDGTVVLIGEVESHAGWFCNKEEVTKWTDVVDVFIGEDRFVLALKSDGTVHLCKVYDSYDFSTNTPESSRASNISEWNNIKVPSN